MPGRPLCKGYEHLQNGTQLLGTVLLVISDFTLLLHKLCILHCTHTFSLKVMIISDEDGQLAQEVFLLAPLNHPNYSPHRQNGQLEHSNTCSINFIIICYSRYSKRLKWLQRSNCIETTVHIQCTAEAWKLLVVSKVIYNKYLFNFVFLEINSLGYFPLQLIHHVSLLTFTHVKIYYWLRCDLSFLSDISTIAPYHHTLQSSLPMSE